MTPRHLLPAMIILLLDTAPIAVQEAQKLTRIDLGIATGVAIPLETQAKIVEQLLGTVRSFADLHGPAVGYLDIFNTTIIGIGIITSLVYFFFSKEHKGAFGAASRIGIWVLMITFGASFGYTVMGRISLLVGRLTFLVDDWLGLITG